MTDANPYRPPSTTPDAASESDDTARRLRGPTTGLILLLGMQIVGYAIAGIVAIVTLVLGSRLGASLMEIGLYAIHFFVMLFMLRSITRIRRLASLRHGRIAAGLACIPVVSPWIWLGIPLGLWLSVLLSRPATAEAFRSASKPADNHGMHRSGGSAFSDG